MKKVARGILAAVIAVLVVGAAGVAKAATYVDFKVTDPSLGTHTFTLAQNDTPTYFDANGFFFYNVPTSPPPCVNCTNTPIFGDSTFTSVPYTDGFGRLELGATLYSGPTSSPFFLVGTYTGLNRDTGLINTLVISDAASVVPVPAALPLFATGLAGLGIIAYRRKRKQAA